MQRKNVGAASLVRSDALLERIVRKAFKAGQTWAETYVSWFDPSAEDTERKVKDAVTKAKRMVRSNAPHQARAVASRPECGCSANLWRCNVCGQTLETESDAPPPMCCGKEMGYVCQDEDHSPDVFNATP